MSTTTASATTIHRPDRAPPGTPRRMRCIAWKSLPRNTLLGFATIEHASGLVLSDITVHRKGDRCWASPPGKPKLDPTGTALRDRETGRIDYATIVSFEPDTLRLRWSDAVIAAVRRDHPEAFEPAPVDSPQPHATPARAAASPRSRDERDPPRADDDDLNDAIPF